MLTALFGLLALSALIQPNAPRLLAVVAFVGLTIAHDALASGIDGFWYYGSAAILDVGIIILTSGIRPLPRMVVTLHRICMASVMMNFLGWLMWFFYLPPTLYDFAFLMLYSCALITFIKKDHADVGGFEVDSWRSCVLGFVDSGRLGVHKHGSEV